MYVGGRLTPHRLTPARVVDGLEADFGKHAGFRRNHAKGVSVSGSFSSNGAGVALSKAAVFERDRQTPVIGRFSLSGGVPDVSDAPMATRGLGLRFDLPGDEQWRTAMINLPAFPDRTPRGFHERNRAFRTDPGTGKPDPAKTAAFLKRHPETALAMRIAQAHPPTSGFADSTFNGLNTFHFTNDSGRTVPVRWSLAPLQPVRLAAEGAANGRDALFEGLINALEAGPLRWRLVLVIGRPADPVNDATVPWPESRRKIDAGTLTIGSARTEASGNARDINFDPTVVPPGITPSDDPLLSARSAVYAQSFARRTSESKSKSAVDVTRLRND
ncbi:catalase family peroxidase [Streptomyces sp. SID10853]|uniref:catalase family peroxidase n=1 Tax=Streptomyces sp. SID10853 TaxID=2706028 RepID=UPI0013C064A2|nr:catalase family peroxidase [Streptomyces sp. SID10853]NDZ81209.1 catalase family peroxidase [Streptomyces sp. SID10853]